MAGYNIFTAQLQDSDLFIQLTKIHRRSGSSRGSSQRIVDGHGTQISKRINLVYFLATISYLTRSIRETV